MASSQFVGLALQRAESALDQSFALEHGNMTRSQCDVRQVHHWVAHDPQASCPEQVKASIGVHIEAWTYPLFQDTSTTKSNEESNAAALTTLRCLPLPSGILVCKTQKNKKKKNEKNTQIVHVFVLQPSTSTISSISWHLVLIESFEHQLPWEKTEHHHFMQSYNYQGPRPSLCTWTYNVYECVERSTISIDILQ